jgi:DNA-binding transcriptional LysR family regulator
VSVDRRSLDGLDVLGAVVEAGSFVRAGEALGLTQSAVSRAVARLEDRIGVRIFRRTARSISLTDEGRRFYESVAPHLAAIVEAMTEAGDSMSRVRGRLRVNVDAGIGQFVLTPHLQPFLAQHPHLGRPWLSAGSCVAGRARRRALETGISPA